MIVIYAGGVLVLLAVVTAFILFQYWDQVRGGFVFVGSSLGVIADSRNGCDRDEDCTQHKHTGEMNAAVWIVPFACVLLSSLYAEWWLIFLCFLGFMAVVVWSWIAGAVDGVNAGVGRTKAVLAHKLLLANGVIALLLCIPIVVSVRSGLSVDENLATLYAAIVWSVISLACVFVVVYTRRTRVL